MDSKGLQRAGSEVKKLFTNILNNEMFMNIMKVIVVIVIVKLVYDWWMGGIKTVYIIPDTISGLSPKTITNAVDPDAVLVKPLLENSKIGREFTISMWLYINDWGNISEPQHVFHIGNEDQSDIVPGIWLYPKNNNIMVRMDTISQTDKHEATINCHQNGQVLDTLEKAQKLCRSKGFMRVCSKKEVIDSKHSPNACCPSWTSTLNNGSGQVRIVNESGWYQGNNYLSKRDSPSFTFAGKEIDTGKPGGWDRIRIDDSSSINTNEKCRDKCYDTENCAAYDFNTTKQQCQLWKVDPSSENYKPKNPEMINKDDITTVIPQTSEGICGKRNTWHSNALEETPRGVHCCGKSNKPQKTDTADKPCDIINIPVQRWVHIGVVLQNKTLDVYLNGSLKRSCILKNIPKSIKQTDNIYINQNGGFDGKLSNIKYTPKALTSEEIISEYSGFFGGKNSLINKLKGPFGEKDLNLSNLSLSKKGKLKSTVSNLFGNSGTDSTESTESTE